MASTAKKVDGKSNHKFEVWGKSLSCTPSLFFEPEDRDTLKQILRQARDAGKKVRVVGSGHSMCEIAMTDDYMICLKKMNEPYHVDKKNFTIKVGAGMDVKNLNKEILPKNGLGISAQPIVDDLTVGGLVAVGAHGHGRNFQTLSARVLEMELMKASGEIICISKDANPDLLPAARLSLGCLGIILTVTLQCEPAFNLEENKKQITREKLFDELEDHISSADYYVFAWAPKMTDVDLRTLTRTKTQAQGKRSDLLFCTGAPNAYVSEMMVPKSRMKEAFLALQEWGSTGKSAIVSTEAPPFPFKFQMSMIKKDDVMLSPAYCPDASEDTFTSFAFAVPRPEDVKRPIEEYFHAFATILKECGGRPHWPLERFLTYEDIAGRYPKWSEFQDIRKRMDPEGLFMNQFLKAKLEPKV